MIVIDEKDFLDVAMVILQKGLGDALDFYLDLIKTQPISHMCFDSYEEICDLQYTANQMLDLEKIMYERGLIR